ncbi:hypothetical protein [Streptomyces bottropensis]|uniref:hypothetical protein n=1 Tax=Streptomyces bottropensis TaxID=42235 RepID=UPI0036CAE172
MAPPVEVVGSAVEDAVAGVGGWPLDQGVVLAFVSGELRSGTREGGQGPVSRFRPTAPPRRSAWARWDAGTSAQAPRR